MNIYKLFIADNSKNTIILIDNIKKLLDECLLTSYTLDIINIANNSDKAIEYKIIAIPTLIRMKPEPEKRIIGYISDFEKIKYHII